MRAAPAEVTAILYAEAHALDRQDWDAWLALYADDAVFWIPAWPEAHRTTADPDTEISLVYCAARAGLEDRVWRVRSGLSVASAVLPRTAHAVTTSLLVAGDADSAEVHSSFTSHVFDLKRGTQHAFFGRYEHRLRRTDAGWRITAKKIVLMNDRIPTMIDFYSV